MVVAIYQGGKPLKHLKKYIPREFDIPPSSRAESGRILALLVLGPVDSPHRDSDSGWFHEVTPRGANASLHRVVTLWKLPLAYSPVRRYSLGGGLMLMHAEDMHGLCQSKSCEPHRTQYFKACSRHVQAVTSSQVCLR